MAVFCLPSAVKFFNNEEVKKVRVLLLVFVCFGERKSTMLGKIQARLTIFSFDSFLGMDKSLIEYLSGIDCYFC